jgi:Transposase IS116/IS110/IS902 family
LAEELAEERGLGPRATRGPGHRQRRGRITKAGNQRMRWLLVQAAVRPAERRSRSSRRPAPGRPPPCDAVGRHALCHAARPQGPLPSEGRCGGTRRWPSEAPNLEPSGIVRDEMSGTLVSRRFDRWVSMAQGCAGGTHGGTPRLSVRRRLRAGKSFDAAMTCDPSPACLQPSDSRFSSARLRGRSSLAFACMS